MRRSCATRRSSHGVPTRAARLGRPSDGAHARARLVPALGRRGLAQARGSRAHRRAQDQQRDRPGAARAAPRREARDRRDGCGSAWRRDRRGLRAARHAVHGLHGRGRHGAPGAERRPHAAAGRDGRAGRERRPHAARGDRRSAARLGVGSGRHLLLLGSAVGPHPYPYLVRELQSVIGREARAQMLERPAACPTSRSPASAAARTRSVSSIRFRRATETCVCSASRPAAAADGLGENAATLAYGHARRAARLLLAAAAGRPTARSRKRIRCRRGSTTRASDPSTRCSRASAACSTRLSSDDEALDALAECCAPKASCRRSRPRTRSRARRRWARAHPGSRDPDRPFGTRRQGHADPRADALVRALEAQRVNPITRGDSHIRAGRRRRHRRVPHGGLPGPGGLSRDLEAVAAAADVVEIGVPFSDPMADGADDPAREPRRARRRV